MGRFAFLGTVIIAFALSLAAQDKPRVFVQGKGSEDVNLTARVAGGHHWGAWGSRSTIDSHDESIEVTKDLQKNCSAVIVTLNQSNADYTVMLNRESKRTADYCAAIARCRLRIAPRTFLAPTRRTQSAVRRKMLAS